MGSSLCPVSYLAVLAIIVLTSNITVQAKRTFRIQKLEKVTEDNSYLRSRLRVAESEENELKVSGYLDLNQRLDNDWTVRSSYYIVEELIIYYSFNRLCLRFQDLRIAMETTRRF